MPNNSTQKKTIVWHVTPMRNLSVITKEGLRPCQPEPDGDNAISFFKRRTDAIKETKRWLQKRHPEPLVLLKIDATNIPLTETFSFELITTNGKNVMPDRILSNQPMPYPFDGNTI